MLLAIYETLKGAYLRFEQNDGIAMAGYIAFSGLLAIFPFLIFATALTGLMLGPEYGNEAIDALFRLAPENIAQTLEPVLVEILEGRGDNYITISILATIWLASNALDSFRVAFDRAYGGERRRNIISRRLRAIAFVFVGAIVAAVLGVSIIFAPALLSIAGRWTNFTISNGTVQAGFVLGVIVFMLFLMLMHRYLPSHKMKGLRIWPGVLVTVVLWVSGAVLFSYFLTLTPGFAITYGTLSGVIITLVFFYLSGVTIIIGAEINAELLSRDATEKSP